MTHHNTYILNKMLFNRESTPRSDKSIYARGADDGFWMGLYLVVIFFSMVAALQYALANALLLVLLAGVPALTFWFLRRSYRADNGLTPFSGLWMQGIVMFGCSALIFCLTGYLYLRWMDPEFISRVLSLGLEFYRQADTPEAQEVVEELELIQSNPDRLLSARNVVMGWMWLIVFSGSLLSMLMAGLVKLRRVSRAEQPK